MNNSEHDADAPGNDPAHARNRADAPRRDGESGGAAQPRQAPGEDARHGGGNATGPGSEESMIDETLHHALSDLEQILERHRGKGEAVAGTGEQRAGDAVVDEGTDQYTIPLLDEVVRAGNETLLPPLSAGAIGPGAARVTDERDDFRQDSEPALRRRLAERLASEIEIITQDRIEAALEKAREEIRVQIRNHLDIILPEVVEELSQARRRRDNDPER